MKVTLLYPHTAKLYLKGTYYVQHIFHIPTLYGKCRNPYAMGYFVHTYRNIKISVTSVMICLPFSKVTDVYLYAIIFLIFQG